MVNKNYILTQFLAMVWICFVYLPSNLAAQNTVDAFESELSLNELAANTGQYKFIVAQNDRNGETENGSDPKPGEKSGQAGKSDKQPSKPKREADPVEPFEPTEKVQPDQAVDFPYDI
jgi:hypothetical protein